MRSFSKRVVLYWIVIFTVTFNSWMGQWFGRSRIRPNRDFSIVEPKVHMMTAIQEEFEGTILEMNTSVVHANESSVVDMKNSHQTRTITILLQLKGELGNHLSVIANARVTQILASKLYPHLSFQFIGQHQSQKNDRRWIRVREELHRCFPVLSDFVMDGGVHDPNFDAVSKQQTAWLNKRQAKLLQNPREEGLALLQRLLAYQERGAAPKLVPSNSTNGKYNYSLPFLVSNSFYWSDGVKNTEMYHALRSYFQFNDSACCRLIPNITDTVYHHRNFNKVSNQKYNLMFSEFSPAEASELLFADVMKSSSNQSKTRIAIVSPSLNGLQHYSQAFTQMNPNVDSYIVSGQTGMQDFCFLLKTQKELVGKLVSTFMEWAALLGNATLNRFYAIEYIQDPMSQTLKLPSVEITGNFEQANRRFIFEKYLIQSFNSSER
jgi:hypothetical protein